MCFIKRRPKTGSTWLGILLVTLLLAACGGGGGGGGGSNNTGGNDAPPPPVSDGGDSPTLSRVAVVGDTTGSELADFLTDKGLAVDNFPVVNSTRPVVSGNWVVWQEVMPGDRGDIYAYHIPSREQRVLASTPAEQKVPAIDGQYVVWMDNRSGDWEIRLHDLSSSTERTVATGVRFSTRPQISGDYITWWDSRNANDDIFLYRISTATEIRITTDPTRQYAPSIAGDILTWTDWRNGNRDIYAYRLSTGEMFPITNDSADQYNPVVNGDHIVWVDRRNNQNHLYGYRLSTGTEFRISTTSSADYAIAGDYVVWQVYQNGGSDIYMYRFSNQEVSRIGETSNWQMQPQIAGDIVLWQEYEESLDRDSLYLYRISTDQVIRLSASLAYWDNSYALDGEHIAWSDLRQGSGDIFIVPVTFSSDEAIWLASTDKTILPAAGVGDYDMLLIGDDLETEYGLNLFDAADEAAVNLLGIGTRDNGRPLGEMLARDGRFGLSANDDDGCDDMAIDVSAAQADHAIFAKLLDPTLDTPQTLRLEEDGSENDEQSYTTDINDPASPKDWQVLATLGRNMCNDGEPAIVEFSTANGTKVILDGSANSYDDYDYWTPARWDLLYNEVVYLME